MKDEDDDTMTPKPEDIIRVERPEDALAPKPREDEDE